MLMIEMWFSSLHLRSKNLVLRSQTLSLQAQLVLFPLTLSTTFDVGRENLQKCYMYIGRYYMIGDG